MLDFHLDFGALVPQMNAPDTLWASEIGCPAQGMPVCRLGTSTHPCTSRIDRWRAKTNFYLGISPKVRTSSDRVILILLLILIVVLSRAGLGSSASPIRAPSFQSWLRTWLASSASKRRWKYCRSLLAGSHRSSVRFASSNGLPQRRIDPTKRPAPPRTLFVGVWPHVHSVAGICYLDHHLVAPEPAT